MLRFVLALSVSLTLGLSSQAHAGTVDALRADFNSDVVGENPQADLPGLPDGDRILYWQAGGLSKVSAGSAEMTDQPLKITKPSGGGITRFAIVPDLRTCDSYVVRWTAMIEAYQAATNFTLRDTGSIRMAVMGFQGNRVWVGSPFSPVYPDMGVPSAYGKAFSFELTLDTVADTYSLSMNGTPIPEIQDFPAGGTAFDRIEVAFGGTSSQYIFVDDLYITADCDASPVVEASWGQIKAGYRDGSTSGDR